MEWAYSAGTHKDQCSIKQDLDLSHIQGIFKICSLSGLPIFIVIDLIAEVLRKLLRPDVLGFQSVMVLNLINNQETYK